jgi:hypothetical protein
VRDKGINMNEIINFVKDIFSLNATDTTPIGLCQFECNSQVQPKSIKRKKNREMRLSELFDK